MSDNISGTECLTQDTQTCQYCDGVPGSAETYKHQVCMPLNGKVQCIDYCIHQIVAALNAGGVWTVLSCCGHQTMPSGVIKLLDGRWLTISKTEPSWLTISHDDNQENNEYSHLP